MYEKNKFRDENDKWIIIIRLGTKMHKNGSYLAKFLIELDGRTKLYKQNIWKCIVWEWKWLIYPSALKDSKICSCK